MKHTTTIAIALLVVLTGVWWILRDEPQTRVEAPKTIAPVEDLRRIELTRLGDDDAPERVVLEIKDGAWTLTSPLESPLSEEIVTRLTSAFSQTIRTDDLRFDDAQAASYELSEELAVKVGLFGAGDAPRAEFYVGKDFVVPQTGARRTFIRSIDSPRIYRAQAELGRLVRTDLDDFRDRRIIALDRDALRKVSITHPDGQIVSVSKGDDEAWTLDTAALNVDFDVDSGEVMRLVNLAPRINALAFADEGDPTGLGLEPAPIKVRFETAADSPVLHVGRVGEGAQARYYARHEGGEFVYELSRHLGEQLTRRGISFRSKTPRPFAAESIERIAFPGDEAVLIERRSSELRIARPRVANPSQDKMTSLLNHVATLRVERYVEQSAEEVGLVGRGLPRVEIRTRDGAHGLIVGPHVEGESGPRYARFADEDTVFVLTEHTANRLFPRASELGEDDA